ncbi:hypothetical protein GIB67_024569 [Kingdonia uniflora]|uniref:Uncharacterized protein n=1 Tax=Kingdonia uniflora TaxID=39325 RepID=A0A7J7LP58_9MAGN|nr:hypothetical protein GIB67_024569 [Kingdonia uniflora]
MAEVPSLFSLCIDAATTKIIHGGDNFLDVFELPSQMFDSLLANLPPLALHILQEQMSVENGSGFSIDGFKNGKKRGRYGDFNTVWKTLFKSRWPEGVGEFQPVNQWTKQCLPRLEMTGQGGDWDQIYWGAHLQSCLNKAAEVALLPSFNGCIGEIAVPDNIMQCVGYKRCICDATCEYSKLSYHCQQFGRYARCLKLQNVLCVAETCVLLRNSKLESIIFQRIKSEKHHYLLMQIDGVCKLLNQNGETLSSLDFNYCKLPSTAVNAICDSLYTKGIQAHGIQYFSIKASSITGGSVVSLPSGLLSFISSGRSLCSINLCDNHLGPNFARMLFDAMFDAACHISMLDLSENNIAGWLSKASGTFSSYSSGIGKSLQSLTVLNLRGNNLRKDDVNGLKYILARMPNLQCLDLSDNPIGDDGIRNLMAYLAEASERDFHLSDLKIENCNLSCNGVTQLLTSLTTLKKPLNCLSIADNDLGSQLAVALAGFLSKSCVRVLNVEDIGLGPSGFLKLREEISKDVKLVHINISKNRGGIETANFIRELALRAPDLAAVNAGYNFMPSESYVILCSALELSKGKLEQLDLTGNSGCYQPAHNCMLAEFQFRGRPIVILPSLPTVVVPHDDDP